MLKQPKVGGGDIQYFTMDKFPRMAQRVQKYKKVLERDAYRVIFSQLMGRVKEAFESRPPVHLAVTGNPGTGKSWFYLYCIFRLVLSLKDEAVELHDIDLVLNFDNDFQLYDVKTKEFVMLSNEEVDLLCDQDRVLRLIHVEGKSSQLTGWSGVSILFASPGLAGMNDYAKLDSCRYIMPVWSLEELQDYNSLLDDELKLAEDVLISRYNKYGGIARFVFTRSETTEDTQLKQAIASFDATNILSYVKQNNAVRDDMYSHRVIAMIPSRDDYLDEYYLDFLSNHIAEEVTFKMADDSLKAFRTFCLAAQLLILCCQLFVLSQIATIMCHRWFSIKLPKQSKRLHHHAM
ncbi:hypothetical protein DVH05_025243 [Phytophthora capsici]|nr:hypothetical protein DVH05_025243 [Phytophthora capsici]